MLFTIRFLCRPSSSITCLFHWTLMALPVSPNRMEVSIYIAKACVTLAGTFVLSTLIIIGTEQSLKYLGSRLMSHSNKRKINNHSNKILHLLKCVTVKDKCVFPFSPHSLQTSTTTPIWKLFLCC